MAAARKRRTRSPHPGVVLIERALPSGRTAWQARYTDPDTGQVRKPMLDALALPTHEARTLWAKQKAKAIAKRRMDLESGAAQGTGKPLADALKAYRDAAEHTQRPKTRVTHELAFAHFERWAQREGIESTADLTRAGLASFRDYLIALPRRASARGVKRRGATKTTARKRSPVSVNRELRSTKTLLNTWRVAGLLPRMDSDAIADALKALPVVHEQPEYLTAAKAEKLLLAALRHDADTHDETRAEHAGLRTPGTTPCYAPIAPFVAVVLLTGMRRGEALGLTWADVDLDTTDHEGRAVGEIRLKGATTKTKRARTIGLEVSPALRKVLAAMKLQAGKDSDNLHVFRQAPSTAALVDDAREARPREPYTVDLVDSARARLVAEYGAPAFDWQTLRSTCATYLTNAPGIFGSASAHLSARQLGHSIAVAEKHYLGVHRGIARHARTLEAALQIEEVLDALLPAERTHSIVQRLAGA